MSDRSTVAGGPERLQIGRVMRAHGVRGALRVAADTDALAGLEAVWIGERRFDLRRVQPERGDFLVELDGVTDRDAADALRGQPVWAARADLPPPADDELYVADLIGCQVFDAAGRRVGEVSGTFFSGAHEILTVTDGTREVLIPFVDAIVTGVDITARRVVIDPPPGLLDLSEGES